MLLNTLSVLIGLLGTIALSETISFNTERVAYGNSTTAFLLVVFSCIILRRVYSRIHLDDKRGFVFAGGYSFALGFALVAGKQLHTVENFALTDLTLWIQILMLAIYFTGPVLYVFQWIAGKESEKAVTAKEGDRKKGVTSFLFTWLVIFICWIPVFLAFYPGAFVYDAQDEYVQVATREFSTHHPLSHVLMLGGFVCLGNKLFGSFNIGIAMYTLVQMAVLSGVFAYTVSYLRTHLSKRLCMGVTLFYGLFPIIPMYAVCSAKDTLFNAAFLLVIVQTIKMLEKVFGVNGKVLAGKSGKKELYTKDMVLFILASAVMMLFRNNGVIAYMILLLVVAVLAVLRYKKERFFVYLAVAMLASFILYSSVDKTLAFVLNADDSENQELLTVPIQQLARTWKYSPEVFSEEEKEILFSYIPEDILKIYDADLSDLVKANFDNQKYAEDTSGFWKVWVKGFTRKPVTYLNAWFMTSYGYWYPDTVINVYGGQQRFTFRYGDSSYFGFETELPGERDSKFPWLEEQYRRMSLELYQQNVPGISMLFSPGFMFWIFMGSFLMCWYRKNYVKLLPMTGIFLLWFSVIPGPTFLVRYVLILWFALPLILFVNKR